MFQFKQELESFSLFAPAMNAGYVDFKYTLGVLICNVLIVGAQQALNEKHIE